MKKLLTKLLGGRPMEYVETLFYDPIGNEVVNLYIDKFGRHWMATSRWALFRVER